jgi:hypothetical protein
LRPGSHLRGYSDYSCHTGIRSSAPWTRSTAPDRTHSPETVSSLKKGDRRWQATLSLNEWGPARLCGETATCLASTGPRNDRSMLIVVVMIVVMILIPVMLGFPPVVSSIPPLVILIPATLAFCIQIAPPFFGLVAVLTIFLDRPVQSPFRLLDRMLALSSIVVSVRPWCCYKKAKRSRHYRGHGHFPNSSIQGFSFRFAGG